MTTEKKEKLLCWLSVLVLSDRALLPTTMKTNQGHFSVDPIQQIDYRNRQELIDALANAIKVGNPIGEAPSRESQRERTSLEKLVHAKSWADLERKSIYFSIALLSSAVEIKSWGRAPDGTWSDEKATSLNVKIPQEAGAEGIADVILEHLSQRRDLPGLSI
ncbi:MAG: hypothetical protein P4L53_20855 [Candidatus Obscuribacterales bacterium]|nr:hypothetical protein [Candidatus Obscuribacterales bacterium]